MRSSGTGKQKSPQGSRAVWKRVLATLVVLASLLWVLWLLEDAWVGLARELRELHSLSLLAGLALGSIATYLGFIGFRLLLPELSGRVMPLPQLAHLYFVAQLMKHLPGRFWGIAYQVAVTRGQIAASSWLAANLLHMLLMMYLAVVISGAALIGTHSLLLAAAWVMFWLAACIVPWLPRCRLRLTAVTLPGRWPFARKLQDAVSTLFSIRPRVFARVVFVLFSSWVIYLAAWGLYASAHPSMDFADGVRMCALYSVAWLAGYLAFVTPSGIGVRELVFAVVSSGFPSSAVAYGIVIGRLSLLFIDLALALLFIRPSNHA